MECSGEERDSPACPSHPPDFTPIPPVPRICPVLGELQTQSVSWSQGLPGEGEDHTGSKTDMNTDHWRL